MPKLVPAAVDDSLVLVHVIFRHGARTPENNNMYPKDPHINLTYYPFGHGQLTNLGKQQGYRLGQLLRQRYDKFLGDVYYPGLVNPWASNFDRTKATLFMVLASLFVPNKETSWHETLKWQPIPIKFLRGTEERMFLARKNVPNAYETYLDYVQSNEGQALMDKHRDVIAYVEQNSGLTIETPRDMLYLACTLASEEHLGLKLPLWTEKVWYKEIENVTVLDYTMLMATKKLRFLTTGVLMQRIVNESKLKMEGKSDYKMHLYSGHDNNVAAVLMCLKVFNPHIPKYCSNILIELHRKDGAYGFKVFYQRDLSEQPVLQQIPNCGTFCDCENFVNVVKDVFGEN